MVASPAAQVSSDNTAALWSEGEIAEAHTPLTYASQDVRRYAFVNRRTE